MLGLNSYFRLRNILEKNKVDLFACCLIFIYNWASAWQNQQNGMCAQRNLRSAWASAQSDQSLRCPHEESKPLHEDWSDWADAQADMSLRWAHMPFLFLLVSAGSIMILL